MRRFVNGTLLKCENEKEMVVGEKRENCNLLLFFLCGGEEGNFVKSLNNSRRRGGLRQREKLDA